MDDYSFLFDEESGGWSSEYIKARFEALFYAVDRFINLRKLNKYVYCNEYLLNEVVLDYFTDIYRLKKFHHIEKISKYKIAAYTAGWIMKRKPIQFKSSVKIDKATLKDHSFLEEVNGYFAIYVVITTLYDTTTELMHEFNEAWRKMLFTEFSKTFVYSAKFRDINCKCLELATIALDANAPYECREM